MRGQAPRGSRLCLGHSRRGFVASLGVAAVLAVTVAIVGEDTGLVRGEALIIVVAVATLRLPAGI